MKKSRLGPAHRLVDLHAAEARVDAPALAGGVARPDEAHVAPLAGGVRKLAGAPGSLTRFQVGKVLEADAIEDLAASAGRSARSSRAVKSVCLDAQGTAQMRRGVAEALGGRAFDDHARRAVGAAPDDGAGAGEVAAWTP